MATQKLISLFEEVRTGKDGITKINKSIAQENAVWFYNKCKTKYTTMTNTDIEDEADILIERILRWKELLINNLKNTRKQINEYNNKLKEGEEKKPNPSIESSLGSFLIKELKTHFKKVDKLVVEKNSSKKISYNLLFGLKRLDYLPKKNAENNDDIWTEKEIVSVVNFYHKKFHELSLKNDDYFAAYERLFAAYEYISNIYSVEYRNPGIFIKVAKQFFELENDTEKQTKKNLQYHLRKLNGKLKKWSNPGEFEKQKKVINISLNAQFLKGVIGDISEENDKDFEIRPILMGIEEYTKAVITRLKLTGREKLYFNNLIEVIRDEKNRNLKSKTELILACDDQLISMGWSDAKCRKVYSDLRGKLMKDKDDLGSLARLYNSSVDKRIIMDPKDSVNIIDSFEVEKDQQQIDTEMLMKFKHLMFNIY